MVCAATPMSATATMHKDVHQRADQQKKERQRNEKVGPVLAQQKVRCYRPEYDQADGVSGAPKGRFRHLPWLLIVVVFVVHL